MKVTVLQIVQEEEEEVIVRCHDSKSAWVESVTQAAGGGRLVCGYKNGNLHRLKLSDIYYFEVVEHSSFIYTKEDVFDAHEKLYEFESIAARSSLFRCSKSMILNAEKIDYVRPSLSGRYNAVLSNGEMVVISRRYVADLKQLLGM